MLNGKDKKRKEKVPTSVPPPQVLRYQGGFLFPSFFQIDIIHKFIGE